MNLLLLLATLACLPTADAATLGLFQEADDVGKPARPGRVQYDPALESYRVTGGGANMWFARDDFHWAWTRVSGDVSLTATIHWAQPGGNAHRKACLLIRQGLQPDAAYVDAALHGDGLTSLQFREQTGQVTHEVQANVRGPTTLRLERCGDFFWISWKSGEEEGFTLGGSTRVALQDPILVGLGVCAHDDQAAEEALFSRVQLVARPHQAATSPRVASTLEVVDIASQDRRAVFTLNEHFEAPNWSRDGRHLLLNKQGRIWKVAAEGGNLEALDTGFAGRCNNDHGLSADGLWLAISDQSQGTGKSLIYVLPATGGTPKQVTEIGPSYWHGWSPDGQRLAYCGERDGEYDVYTVAVAGGPERRLTTAKGLDDGPDYSPDGKWIYFNSERGGHMQIWRMRPDGSDQEPVTADALNNWFPHPSPDGKWIAFLSYEPDIVGHPANQPVQIRLLPTGGGEPRVLARVFGGQGTLNVPSWSPDSRRLAFVSYRLVHH